MALTQVSTDGVKDGSLLNADINASAAIARTKLANVDLVDDTSPQLGGDLDTNSFEILLDDNHAVKFGNDTDLTVLHSGSTGVINNVTGDLFIKTTGSGDDIVLTSNDDIELQPQAGEDGIKVIGNGAVELYYDNSKRLQTEAWGTRIFATGQDALLVVQGEEDRSATLRLQADDGDDYPDYSQFHKNKDTGKLHIQNLTGSDVWEDNIVCVNNGAVELYYDNSKKLTTNSTGIDINTGGSDVGSSIKIYGHDAIKRNYWGYGATYKGIQIGRSDSNVNSSIFMGVDPSSNTSGAFGGYGGEIIFRNDLSFYHPNNANDNWKTFMRTGRFGDTGAACFPNGLGFGSDTATANILDDYEEGTWTPSTTEGMNTIYGAHYIKVGAKVSIQAYIALPTSSSSDNIRIDSFPFTAKGSNHFAIGASYSQWSGSDHIFIQMSANTSQAHIYKNSGNAVTFADGSGGYFLFSMTYFIA
jgi:hypothetical protein